MVAKLLCGVGGTFIGACSMYVLNKRKIENLRNISIKKDDEINTLRIENMEKDSSLKATVTSYEAVLARRDNIEQLYIEVDKLINEFKNIDRIGEILNINNESNRNICIGMLDAIVEHIKNETTKYVANLNTDPESVEYAVKNISADLNKKIRELDNKVHEFIQDNDDDDDEDLIGVSLDDDDDEDEDDVFVIHPTDIVVKCVNGNNKVYKADSVEGFEVILADSDIEENQYCIMAQYIPELYSDLKASVMNQIKDHYVNQIDNESFEYLLDEVEIVIYLNLAEDNIALLSGVKAVIPFDVFSVVTEDSGVLYFNTTDSIVEDVDLQYFIGYDEDDNNDSSNNAESDPIIEDPENIEVIVDFVVESINFNRDSLKGFVGKLDILKEVNPDAALDAYKELFDIVREIHRAKNSNDISNDVANGLKTRLQLLKEDTLKNHGGEIRKHKQQMKEAANA